MKVLGKVIVVTGAGHGMGRELTLELVRRGARVAAVDINPQTLAETAALLPGRSDSIATFTTDISDAAAVEALAERVQQHFGAVDGLINNAGIIQPFVKLAELDMKTIDRVFNVNFRGTLYTTKAFLPIFMRRPEAHIVNISSMGGFLPVPGQTIYGGSKAAVKLITEGLHSELRGTPVHVTVVFPGGVGTNIAGNSGVQMNIPPEAQKKARVTAPYDAACQILDGMERNAYRVLVGNDAKFLDLFYRVAPAQAAAFIAKQMRKLLSI